MTEALIDTDILSYFFKGGYIVVQNFRNYLNKFDFINISIITYYEILGGLQYKRAENQIKQFEEFAKNNNIIYISEASAKSSSEIYASLREVGITIGTSDILIAGIAIENNLTLVSNNLKHYEYISELEVENWKTIIC